MSIAISAFVATSNVVAPQPMTFDLALEDLRITSVVREIDRIEIEFVYRVVNVGDVEYDPQGTLPGTNGDVLVQTYLSDMNTSPAAGGRVIMEAPELLAPGESFEGWGFANTANLDNPLAFGDHVWLVVDLGNTGEEPENLWNNRVKVLVPAPGTAALACLGLVACSRRRRS
ncbi:MAG: hypothetical protein AAGI53_16230 [Planctomycetota bacterium]